MVFGLNYRKIQRNLPCVSVESFLTMLRDKVRVLMKRLSDATVLPVIRGSFQS